MAQILLSAFGLCTLADNAGENTDIRGAAMSEQEAFEQELEGSSSSQAGREVMEFLGACFMLTARRVAGKNSFHKSLKLLAAGNLSRKEASEIDFCRTVALCVDELAEAELKQFNEGKLLEIPKQYADKATKPEAKALVLQMADPVWVEMQVGAEKMLTIIAKSRDTVPSDAGSASEKRGEMNVLLASVVVLILIFGFLLFKVTRVHRHQEKIKSPAKKKKKAT
eukprot:gnl/MRDRNA2_/MRDRNA2_50035_c0_seq1.p1 gnl/MRDRNA2_/MRDRNA2_50035_c0~~gnl/MRDRNA2_/MRDRNA2_50035_c0_seq1.p1  ORF type:complete len:239 (+),score=60.25 gnl/MRDRNA2_/MRDRNA2_50035_c0_seq1:48-719(+)